MVNLVLEQVRQQAVAPLDLYAGVAIDPHVDAALPHRRTLYACERGHGGTMSSRRSADKMGFSIHEAGCMLFYKQTLCVACWG